MTKSLLKIADKFLDLHHLSAFVFVSTTLSFDERYPHLNVINRPVTTSRGSALNHLHDIKAFLHLTKHGILSVKMGSAADGGVNLYLLVRETGTADTFLGFCYQAVLQLLESGAVAVFTQLNNL